MSWELRKLLQKRLEAEGLTMDRDYQDGRYAIQRRADYISIIIAPNGSAWSENGWNEQMDNTVRIMRALETAL